MFEKEKKEILDAALEIKKCNLISLSGGNVSMRAGENLFLVTPSGMIYEEMTADDVVVIDRDCRVVEGTRKPSSDSPALVYMEFLVTLIDANGAAVNVAPFTPSSDIGMGIMAVKYAGEARAVILKHHGIMAYGSDMKEALYSAIYLEEAAKTFVLAKSMGAEIPLLDPEDIAKEKRGWLDYGQ